MCANRGKKIVQALGYGEMSLWASDVPVKDRPLYPSLISDKLLLAVY